MLQNKLHRPRISGIDDRGNIPFLLVGPQHDQLCLWFSATKNIRTRKPCITRDSLHTLSLIAEYVSYVNIPATTSQAGTGMIPYNWKVIFGATHARNDTTEYIAAVNLC